jgi:thiamine-monophosphate kinase
VVDITVTGSVHRRRFLTRDGARAGDALYVTGRIGGAAEGLSRLRANHEDGSPQAKRYLRPEPRVRAGLLLGRNRAARACVDLSDGLADGIRQIADASGVGAVIDAAAIPLDRSDHNFRAALAGGEDYELLFAVPPKTRRRLAAVQKLVGDLPITRIGTLTKDRTLVLDVDGAREELPRGFEHFA